MPCRLTAPSLGLLGVLLSLTLPGCGKRLPSGPWRELAHFDFEEQGWSPLAERRASAARAGDWGGYLDGGFRGSSAFSPLVEVGNWHLLEVTWQLRIDEVGQRGFRLFLHGYEAAPSPHPAIPELPISGESVILGSYEEPLEGWNQHGFVVQRRKLPPAATWVRLEWRILSPLGEADRDAGAFAFDEVVIRSKGS